MAAAPEKHYITADKLLLHSCQLGRKILDSGFRPTFIVGIWRGGAPVGIAVQEFLYYHGIKSDHICIRTSSYKGYQQSSSVAVHGLAYIVDKATAEDSLLLVDDIFDTGRSCQAVLQSLKDRMRLNLPHDIRIAVPFYKPHKNMTNIKPNYWVFETDKWVVFPHECDGMDREEVARLKGPEMAALFDEKQHV
eukprot:m51a1_g2520 putative hypoxanthine phosphoribosyltransferase (192) ;mRNA; f:218587-219743